jgi:hypothetical protein
LLGGNGISKVGNTFSADVDDVGVEIAGGQIAIKSGGISHVMLGPLCVEPDNIKKNSITKDELASDCVERDEIKDGEVVTSKLATDAVTSIKILDGEVGEDKLATDAVTETKIEDGAVKTAKIEDNAVTSQKIGSGEVKPGNIDTNAVTNAKIHQGAVDTDELATGAVTLLKMAQNSVGTNQIVGLNVTETKLAQFAVVEDKIKANAVTETKIKNGAVKTDKIADDAVTALKLANSSVTTSKIGTLTSLNVNGIITATSFLASGSGTETDGGFALPKSKSLSITYDTDQTISPTGTFETLGGSVPSAGLNFAFDDNITMAVTFSVFQLHHSGPAGTPVGFTYEVSFYDGSGSQQAFSDRPREGGMLLNSFSAQQQSLTAPVFQLNHYDIVGNGTSRIASIRLRVKHFESQDTVKAVGSFQLTCLAVDDTSGNVSKTYNAGTLS